MEKINIELDNASYRNIHLLLHILIELTSTLSTKTQHSPEQYQELIKSINEPLKTIKKTLESK
ncbi:hypothetical protein COA01_15815 [Bacillus cereus]|nr:hypothetical protein COA01_15815 [Bacillus cereus]